jgi:hypothetical protein
MPVSPRAQAPRSAGAYGLQRVASRTRRAARAARQGAMGWVARRWAKCERAEAGSCWPMARRRAGGASRTRACSCSSASGRAPNSRLRRAWRVAESQLRTCWANAVAWARGWGASPSSSSSARALLRAQTYRATRSAKPIDRGASHTLRHLALNAGAHHRARWGRRADYGGLLVGARAPQPADGGAPAAAARRAR